MPHSGWKKTRELALGELVNQPREVAEWLGQNPGLSLTLEIIGDGHLQICEHGLIERLGNAVFEFRDRCQKLERELEKLKHQRPTGG